MHAAILPLLLALTSAPQQADTSPHSEASLVSAVKSIQPGKPFNVAIRIKMDPHWHCYWLNPGDSGSKIEYKWNLPKGFKVTNVHWPAPKIVEMGGIISYGYEDEVLLLVDLQAPHSIKPGTSQRLSAKVEWLICNDTCLMAEESVSLTLPVTKEPVAKNPAMVEAFNLTRTKLARPSTWTMKATREIDAYVISVNVPGELSGEASVYFYSREAEVVAHGARQAVSRRGNALELRVVKSEYEIKPAERLKGLLVVKDRGDEKAYQIDVPVVR